MLRFAVIACVLAVAVTAEPNGDGSCYVVERWSPYPTCYQPPDEELCHRGWGAYDDKETCCWRSFSKACETEPKDCYVVEDYTSKSCVKDDRMCLRDWGVYTSMEDCCKYAFDGGCNAEKLDEECWIHDNLYTARKLCRKTQSMCSLSWLKKYPSQEECCAPGALYSKGCDEPPPTTCWLVESYNPKLCRRADDAALCARNWGIFNTEEECCSSSFGGECDKMHGLDSPAQERAGDEPAHLVIQ